MNLKTKNNFMTKLFHLLLFAIIFVHCKNEPQKKIEYEVDSVQKNKHQLHNPEEKSVDCYDYLTELVRSSNFPFSEWKISKNMVNLLIDEEHNGQFIRAKLLVNTHGTGTIGWIEYYYDSGKLLDISANLETSKELKYDTKWKELFEACNLKKTTSHIAENNENNSLGNIYNKCNELSLPIKYSFDLINAENDFLSLDKGYYSLFPIQYQDDYQIAKLPVKHGYFKPIILITYNEMGQSTWHLFVLNNEYVPISNIILYTNIELDNANSKVTTFNISSDYKITITESEILNFEEKIISKKVYYISDSGQIVAL